MKIVSEYILRELGRYFSLFLGLFVFIYLLIDVLDRVDNFIEYKSTLAEVGLYFLCKLPMIVLQMSAVSLMLSVIVTLCLLNRHNEFTALKASGISAFRLTLPLVLIGLFISLVNFTLSEGVIPKPVPGPGSYGTTRCATTSPSTPSTSVQGLVSVRGGDLPHSTPPAAGEHPPRRGLVLFRPRLQPEPTGLRPSGRTRQERLDLYQRPG